MQSFNNWQQSQSPWVNHRINGRLCGLDFTKNKKWKSFTRDVLLLCLGWTNSDNAEHRPILTLAQIRIFQICKNTLKIFIKRDKLKSTKRNAIKISQRALQSCSNMQKPWATRAQETGTVQKKQFYTDFKRMTNKLQELESLSCWIDSAACHFSQAADYLAAGYPSLFLDFLSYYLPIFSMSEFEWNVAKKSFQKRLRQVPRKFFIWKKEIFQKYFFEKVEPREKS